MGIYCMDAGLWVAIAVGSAAGTAILLLIILGVYVYIRRKRRGGANKKGNNSTEGGPALSLTPTRHVIYENPRFSIEEEGHSIHNGTQVTSFQEDQKTRQSVNGELKKIVGQNGHAILDEHELKNGATSESAFKQEIHSVHKEVQCLNGEEHKDDKKNRLVTLHGDQLASSGIQFKLIKDHGVFLTAEKEVEFDGHRIDENRLVSLKIDTSNLSPEAVKAIVHYAATSVITLELESADFHDQSATKESIGHAELTDSTQNWLPDPKWASFTDLSKDSQSRKISDRSTSSDGSDHLAPNGGQYNSLQNLEKMKEKHMEDYNPFLEESRIIQAKPLVRDTQDNLKEYNQEIPNQMVVTAEINVQGTEKSKIDQHHDDQSIANDEHLIKEEKQLIANDQHLIKSDQERIMNHQHQITTDQFLIKENQHQIKNDQHQIKDNQHQITNDQFLIKNDQHQIKNNQHQIKNDQHQIKNNQHQIKNDQSLIKNEQHQIKNDQHQIKDNEHQTKSDQHQITNDQFLMKNDHYQIMNDQHLITDQEPHVKSDQHLIKIDQHQIMDDQHQITDYHSQPDHLITDHPMTDHLITTDQSAPAKIDPYAGLSAEDRMQLIRLSYEEPDLTRSTPNLSMPEAQTSPSIKSDQHEIYQKSVSPTSPTTKIPVSAMTRRRRSSQLSDLDKLETASQISNSSDRPYRVTFKEENHVIALPSNFQKQEPTKKPENRAPMKRGPRYEPPVPPRSKIRPPLPTRVEKVDFASTLRGGYKQETPKSAPRQAPPPPSRVKNAPNLHPKYGNQPVPIRPGGRRGSLTTSSGSSSMESDRVSSPEEHPKDGSFNLDEELEKEQFQKLMYFQHQLEKQHEELSKMGVHVPTVESKKAREAQKTKVANGQHMTKK